MILHTMDVSNLYEEYSASIINSFDLGNKEQPKDFEIAIIFEMIANELLPYVGDQVPNDFVEMIATSISVMMEDEEYGFWYTVIYELADTQSILHRKMCTGDNGLYKSDDNESISMTLKHLGKSSHFFHYTSDTMTSSALFYTKETPTPNYNINVTTIYEIFKISFDNFLIRYFDINENYLDNTKTLHIFISFCEILLPILYSKHKNYKTISSPIVQDIDASIRNTYIVDFKSSTVMTEYLNSDHSLFELIVGYFKKTLRGTFQLCSWASINDSIYLGLHTSKLSRRLSA